MRGWDCRTNDDDCFWLRNLGKGENKGKEEDCEAEEL